MVRWEDYLQIPLQPLADNLDTHTYNVFEKDPVKYDQYQKAIAQALIHLQKKSTDNAEIVSCSSHLMMNSGIHKKDLKLMLHSL